MKIPGPNFADPEKQPGPCRHVVSVRRVSIGSGTAPAEP